MIVISAYYYTTINWIGWVVLKMYINHNSFGFMNTVSDSPVLYYILYYYIHYTRKCAFFFRVALYINQPGWKPSKKVDQLDRKRTQRSVWITLRVSKFYVILFIFFMYFFFYHPVSSSANRILRNIYIYA